MRNVPSDDAMMRFAIALAALAFLGACAQRAHVAADPAFAALDAADQPLRAAFNRERDRVRVVMIVSPTCPICLYGVSEIERTLFRTNKTASLAGLVVWVPMLGGRIANVPAAAALAPDVRILQYWDGSNDLGKAYEEVLPTPGSTAWDVYLLYKPGVLWTARRPPKPTFWMHQLSITNAPRLDPAAFAERARQLTTPRRATLR